MTDVRIGPDREVTLHFALKLENGDVVDSTFDKQPATFKVTGKASMNVEMWLPLLLCVLGFYCFLGAVLLYRMRTEVLKREARSSWVKAEIGRLVEGGA